MQESGLMEIIPLICESAIWNLYPVLSHPESLQGTLLGMTAETEGLALGSMFCLHPESPQGSPLAVSGAEGWMTSHPLFADRAGNIFHSHFCSPLAIKGNILKFYDTKFYG